jgi:hypothetical protein
LTTAKPSPGEDSVMLTLDGQVIVAGCESRIVTANEQAAPLSPKQMTFVVPSGKTVPDGGLHSIVPQPGPEPTGVE